MTLASYIQARRWYRGKAKRLVSATVEDAFPLDLGGERIAFSIVRTTYEDKSVDHYVIPIGETTGEVPSELVIDRQGTASSYEALGNERVLAAVLDKFKGGGTRVEGTAGTLVFRPLPGFETFTPSNVTPKLVQREQSNTSVTFGDSYILKIVRKLDEGRSVEIEMSELLARHGYTSTPPLLGAIEIRRGGTRAGSDAVTLGMLHRFQPNQGDAWTFTLDALAQSSEADAYRPHAELLGRRVGEMHVVLARATEPAFVPERLPREEREKLAAALTNSVARVRSHLRPGDEARIAARIASFVALDHDPVAMRVHGDLHLGQILRTDDDFVIIDFEGEPTRTLAERKAKRSPMADVAGMLRSFDYAAAAALRTSSPGSMRAWCEGTTRSFLRAYGQAAPSGVASDILEFYLLEKCIYEIAYEANSRPDWLAIPQGGLSALLDETASITP